MRKEKFETGSIVHVIKRGARGMEIVRDESDRWRFVKMLYFLNDKNHSENWERDIGSIKKGLHFERPKDWPERDTLVNVLSYCLMPNHFHLILEEKEEGGIPKFIKSFCGSMALYFNKKYKEKGSLFQGPYKARVIDSDYYLELVNIYVNVKNPLELYKGGLKNAIKNFDMSYRWAEGYDFCSLGDYSGKRKNSPIITKHELYRYTPAQYKKLSREYLFYKLDKINNNEYALD